MHIAVIGGGPGGLCAARHALAYNYKVSVFEQTKNIGGTWVYTDQTDTDENGLEIENGLYQNLIINFPKEIMGYPDYPIADHDESYIASEYILDYLNDYAKKFQLMDHIYLEHYVIRVHPKNNKWEVIVIDFKNGKTKILLFDAVMVCNGHYGSVFIPEYEGRDLFAGVQSHSQKYRRAEEFRGHDVLIVGCGWSAMDIIFHAAKVANSVTVSTHANFDLRKMCPDSIDIVPDVAKLTKNGAEFVNGVHKNFTKILYCTGYLRSFPFLSTHCDIKVDDNYVYPLYKHCFNIERPTMTFLGLLQRNLPMFLMDMQARMFMQYLNGNITLPTKEEMLRETEEQMQKIWKNGRKKRHSHWLFDNEQAEYVSDLAEFGKIEPLKPVFLKLYYEHLNKQFENIVTYRNRKYKLVDDETFLIIE